MCCFLKCVVFEICCFLKSVVFHICFFLICCCLGPLPTWQEGLTYFFGYFKCSHIVAKGDLPLLDPRPLRGGPAFRPGNYAQPVGEVWNRPYQNVEAYGWSENEIGTKLFDIVPKLHCPQATKRLPTRLVTW